MGYLKLTQEKLAAASPKVRDAAVTHVHDLIALAVTEHAPLGKSNAGAVAAARLSAALDHIAKTFEYSRANCWRCGA